MTTTDAVEIIPDKINLRSSRSNKLLWMYVHIGDIRSVTEAIDANIEDHVIEGAFNSDDDPGDIPFWDNLYLTPEEAVTLGVALIKSGKSQGARNYSYEEINLGLVRMGLCKVKEPETIEEVKTCSRMEKHCEHYKQYQNRSDQSPQCGSCDHWEITDQYI